MKFLFKIVFCLMLLSLVSCQTTTKVSGCVNSVALGFGVFQVNDLTQLEKTISQLIENKKLSSQTHKNFKNLCSRKSKETKIMLRKLLK